MGVVVHGFISARDRQSRASGRPPKLVAVERAIAHVKYIQHRPGEDKEKGGRTFFDELEDGLNGRSLRKAIRELENSKVVVHKVTLAPEIDPLNQRQYTREVMHQLAAEKQQELKWFAVEHKNTDHHHIHVVVLGKDKHGKDVRIEKSDYSKLREWGDRYLERWQPMELERARSVRMKVRQLERQAEREQRVKDGLELPWMHRKIMREQYEPYQNWKADQEKKVRNRDRSDKQPERPVVNDTIAAAGKQWSKENSVSELRDLHTYLWDNFDERIPLPEYKKLRGWINEKERLDAGSKSGSPTKKTSEKSKKYFEHQGEKYSKDSSYEKLTGLVKSLHESKSPRLPVDEYHNLRSWIENADRARWAGVTERQLDLSKQKFERDGAAKTSPHANRYVNPLQQQMMSNPVVGLFMQGASLANALVKTIDLTDRSDPLKKGKDVLEDAKKDRHKDHVRLDRTPEQKAQDLESIENIDKAIDENKETREQRRKDRETQRRKRDRDTDFMR